MADQFRCHSGYCIESFRLCDGAIDCADRSDESDCGKSHPPPTFHETVGLFEERATIQCKNGDFACFAGEQCVSYTLVCDGHGDCQDFSDEANCSKFFTSHLNNLSISQLQPRHPNNSFTSLMSFPAAFIKIFSRLTASKNHELNLKSYHTDQTILQGKNFFLIIQNDQWSFELNADS